MTKPPMRDQHTEDLSLLFHAALARLPEERRGYLADACAGDARLQEAVEALLAQFENEPLSLGHANAPADLPIASPSSSQSSAQAVRQAATTDGDETQASENTRTFAATETPNYEQPTRLLGDAPTLSISEEERARLFVEPQIGAYRIVRQLGQGGMGTVYLAERDDEFRQTVAIKVVLAGLDNQFVLQRFRNERQILAALDHRNIARLFDGGTTADGRPYFVMEYIEGKPITTYCEEQQLTTVERLQLFRQVCAAVHYAHQNLVIHRDIKPGNILVTSGGVPKLLDFGIAKLLNPALADRTLEATATAVRLMTPEYASPEQLRGDAITTASDVYSLGVLLYQMLTGRKPYRFSSRLPHDIFRAILEQEPEKPSVAIGRAITETTGSGQPTASATTERGAARRDKNLEKLRKRLAGDIDNIVLMALRKEPTRRYASVDQFANDIARHLDGLPVIARRDTFAYRGVKFIRRHKAAALAVLLIVATLIGGIITTHRERQRAERRFNDVRQLANSFLFEFHDAIENLPGATPARELLVRRALEYLDSLAAEAGDEPTLERELATAYEKVGDVQGNPNFGNLGDVDGALASYHKALAIRERLAPVAAASVEDRRALAATYGRIGDALYNGNNPAGVIEAYDKAIAIQESLLAAAPDDITTMRQLWMSYRRTAYAQATAGDLQAGIARLNRAREFIERLVAASPDDAQVQSDLAATYSTMGDALAESDNLDGGIEMFNRAQEILRRLAAAEPLNTQHQTSLGAILGSLGEAQMRKGDWAAALAQYQQALTIFAPAAAADPSNMRAQYNLGVVHAHSGDALLKMERLEEAITHYRQAESLYLRVVGDNPLQLRGGAELAQCYSYLALALAKKGDATEALTLGRRARERAAAVQQAEPTNPELRALAADIYANSGRVHAALAAARTPAAGEALAHWREARQWLQQGFEMLRELQSQGRWTSPDYGTPETLAKEIAACDAAISRLTDTGRGAGKGA